MNEAKINDGRNFDFVIPNMSMIVKKVNIEIPNFKAH